MDWTRRKRKTKGVNTLTRWLAIILAMQGLGLLLGAGSGGQGNIFISTLYEGNYGAGYFYMTLAIVGAVGSNPNSWLNYCLGVERTMLNCSWKK